MLKPDDYIKKYKEERGLFLLDEDWPLMMWNYALYYHQEMEDAKEPDIPRDSTIYLEIVKHLNTKTGRSFRMAPSLRRLIKGRLSEKYSFMDFKKVIDIKTKQWKGTDMEKYLRPSTLFQASKFDGYLNEYGTGTKIDSGDNNFNFKPTDEAELL